MSEIARCPVCGEKPKWFPITGWESGWKTDMLMCCGYGSTSVKGWNKYAAAMELAKTIVASENCKAEDEYKYQEFVEWARQYVLEVFK